MKAHLEKYRNFKTRIEMFGIDREYKQICAFLLGFDYTGNEPFLHGFREWLLNEHSVWSEFAWPNLVKHIYALSDPELRNELDLIAFLFDRIDRFLDRG